VQADSGTTLVAKNPATSEAIGEVPALGAAETRRAIEAPPSAPTRWKHTSIACGQKVEADIGNPSLRVTEGDGSRLRPEAVATEAVGSGGAETLAWPEAIAAGLFHAEGAERTQRSQRRFLCASRGGS
jgi:hypothetical protein